MTTTRVAADRVERIAVLGAGTIGASWTALFLARGLAVDVFDVAPEAEPYVRSYVETAWPALERLNMAAGADPDRVRFFSDGVASVEDVDKAVAHGPGLRWAVMGPHMLFDLGSGGQGLEVFCDRYQDSFHRWWDSLGAPRLGAEVARALAEGVRLEAGQRDFRDLAAERDAKLVAVLNALDGREAD